MGDSQTGVNLASAVKRAEMMAWKHERGLVQILLLNMTELLAKVPRRNHSLAMLNHVLLTGASPNGEILVTAIKLADQVWRNEREPVRILHQPTVERTARALWIRLKSATRHPARSMAGSRTGLSLEVAAGLVVRVSRPEIALVHSQLRRMGAKIVKDPWMRHRRVIQILVL